MALDLKDFEVECHLAGFDFGDVEDPVDEAQHVVGCDVNLLEIDGESCQIQILGILLKHFDVADDSIKWGAQFMAHVC